MSKRKVSKRKPHPNLPACRDCGARPGRVHMIGCDTERCSVCGGQRIQCECPKHDRRFARWIGVFPGTTEAQMMGINLNKLHKEYRGVFVKSRRSR
ncbi:MAG: hypothetical protein V1723_00290 [Candidatus Uhrbacteria bacterium]